MATYAIGDVQGCFTALQRLLEKIKFDPARDHLWFCGDLVNRGPDSLGSLRFIKQLGDKATVILGNHDFHLLAIAHGNLNKVSDSTFEEILKADDKTELLDWLRQQPLIHYDAKLGFILTHAGLYPWWDLDTALACGNEVQAMMQSNNYTMLLEHLYGNEPNHWDENLIGIDRLRFIINAFTRMRYCFADGGLELTYKGAIEKRPCGTKPWFDIGNRAPLPAKLLFGHWASLECKVDVPDVYGLDCGCVWGNKLGAFRLEDEQRFLVECD